MNPARQSSIERITHETRIQLHINLDGTGEWQGSTGVPFMDHMLNHLTVHGLFDLKVACSGDTAIDDHHSVEDLGIVLGMALNEAVADKKGLVRYGSQFVPMDEALVLVVLDFSGRGLLAYDLDLPSERVGTFETALVREFFQALAVNAGLTLHVQLLYGNNSHHIIEAAFKALGRALSQAVRIDERRLGVPSKGAL
jgi:imidazoleglycerol-phosphate dehydratase